MNFSFSKLVELASAIRFLAIEAVEAAQSGHPGMPLGMADITTVLFSNHLKFNPEQPLWPNRDRFIVSNGHGSMLLYSLLYLTGYAKPSLTDLTMFRQISSLAAGHPEYGTMPGIETTTGPLGQGLANAVGMAIAEAKLSTEFGNELIDHFTYVLVGDGCLMEGISFEAMSLAGHLGLSKLIVLYDSNQISIDGATNLSDSERLSQRCSALNWHYLEIDGHNYTAIDAAITTAKASNRPTLIKCNTIIGYGSPNKAASNSSHGAPLGITEAKLTKHALACDWPYFTVPEEILTMWREIGKQHRQVYLNWERNLDQLPAATKEVFLSQLDGSNCKTAESELLELIQEYTSLAATNNLPVEATRKSSGKVLEKLVPILPGLVGGSADLSESNCTLVSSCKPISSSNFAGNYLYYGVREHAMVAIMNGMSLYGGIIPYSGSFLIFSDYARPAIRLAAMMKQRIILVMTHDSIGLGEDGPTHQPVEQLSSLRAIPGCLVLRPADALETAAAWQIALEHNGPTILALTRQNITPVARQEVTTVQDIKRGLYIVRQTKDTNLDYTIFASGSELSIAEELATMLESGGKTIRLVSGFSLELFWKQDSEYITNLLCNDSKKIAIEAGARMSWDRIIGSHGKFFGVENFGKSGKYHDLYRYFGLTAEQIFSHL